jgi:murein DD-endopeptidase MepM/ murein hydrolase activator NlpD
MTVRATRWRVAGVVIVAAVALAVAAAMRLRASRAANDRADASASHDGAPPPWERVDTLRRGETLSGFMARAGVAPEAAVTVLRTIDDLDPRRVRAGLTMLVRGDSAAIQPNELLLHLTSERDVRFTRVGSEWDSRDERILWTTDTIVVHGVVHSTLYDALDAGAGQELAKGARSELAWNLADVYEYRVDMSRELQDGDKVRVLFERLRNAAGATRIGTIFAAGLERNGSEMEAFRFTPRGAKRAEYFDQNGRSLRATFLRAPLSFRRISSVFGLRKHPILGEWRAHKGTDYAANSGTPVRAIGDGTIAFAGTKSGFGNVIEVRHPNGYLSRYGHLRGFAKGMRVGAHVTMGSTIGFVGMTGLATAPHLHFEVLVGGVQRDPGKALKATAGMPLARADAGAFAGVVRVETELLRRK